MNEPVVDTCILERPQFEPHSHPARGGVLPPQLPGLPVIGAFPFLTGDGLARMTSWARTHGDMVEYRSLHVRVCFLNHPDLVEEVLVTRSHKFIHGKGVQANPRFLGRGLLTNEGESWRHQRRLMQPAFHQRSIQRFASLIVQRTDAFLAGWRRGRTLDVYRSIAGLTLDIVARILFDLEVMERWASLPPPSTRCSCAMRAARLRYTR